MKRLLSALLVMALSMVPLASSAEKSLTDWDLSDIYADEAAFEADFALAEEKISGLAAYKGTLGTTDGVLAYFEALDEIMDILAKLSGYASLPTALDQADGAAKAQSARVTNLTYALSEAAAFANPELYSNDDAFLDALEADPRIAEKGHLTQIKRERLDKSHMLHEKEELLLLPLSRLINGAVELFATLTNADIPYPEVVFPDGQVYRADNTGYTTALAGGYGQDFRKEFYEIMMATYAQYRNTLAQNMQNYYLGLSESAAAHHYSSALEAGLIGEDIPAMLYESLLDAARQAEPMMSRYVEFLKTQLGVKELYSFDMNVPFAENPGLTFSFEDACALLPEALAPLGEEYIEVLKTGLSGGWIDAYPAQNKQSGAFSSAVRGVHPYVLHNYTGSFKDASTLAHEMGHAVHQYYSDLGAASYYESNVTIMITEVASTLNELLLSDYMIQNAKTEEEKRYYISQQMSSLFSTFFAQATFAGFQDKIATYVEAGGTLTADALDEMWLATQIEFYGDGLAQPKNAEAGWSRIPHFYYGFYVFKYAMAISAACDIADRILAGEEGAAENYIAYLKAGDTGDAVKMLAIAGVDATNGDFIQALIDRFDRLLKEYGN